MDLTPLARRNEGPERVRERAHSAIPRRREDANRQDGLELGGRQFGRLRDRKAEELVLEASRKLCPHASHSNPSSVTPPKSTACCAKRCAIFTREAIEPQADEHDRSGMLNRPLFEECGKLGLLGITVPAEDGGAGMDAVAAVIAHHELAKSDPGFTLAYLAHAMLFVNNFYYGANAEQRRRYLAQASSPASGSAPWG